MCHKHRSGPNAIEQSFISRGCLGKNTNTKVGTACKPENRYAKKNAVMRGDGSNEKMEGVVRRAVNECWRQNYTQIQRGKMNKFGS